MLCVTFNLCDALYIPQKQLKLLYVLAETSNEIMMERTENKHTWKEK